METQDFLDFLSNFDIARPGMYTVPSKVIKVTLEHYIKEGNLEPLLCYERALYASWNSSNRFNDYLLSKEDTILLGRFLEGEGIIKPNDFFEESVISAIKKAVLDSKRFYKKEDSYRERRKRESRAIQNKELRKKVFEKDNYSCNGCGDTGKLTVDHIIPVKLGGDSSLDNLQTLCRPCNSSKGVKL